METRARADLDRSCEQLEHHVRFTPESGHLGAAQQCPLCAKSGHLGALQKRLLGANRETSDRRKGSPAARGLTAAIGAVHSSSRRRFLRRTTTLRVDQVL